MSRLTAEERFKSSYRVDPSGCWVWMKSLNWGGYGSFWLNGKRTGAHRAAHLLFKGPIPDGHDIDHLCRNRACVNPTHLEPVTRSENLRRGAVGGHFRDKTHCKNGHRFTPDNTYTDPRGWRACRTCAREAGRRYEARKRKASA